MLERFLGGAMLLGALAVIWYMGLQGVMSGSAIMALGCWTVVILGFFIVGVVRNK